MGKTLLILGNGFDLAHGLPTRYSDFLEFSKRVLPIYSFEKKSTEEEAFKQYKCLHLNNKWGEGGKVNPARTFLEYRIEDLFKSRNVNIIPIEGSIQHNQEVHVNERLDKFNEYLKENIWYQYITKLYIGSKMRGENWIDFESEISFMIQRIDEKHESLSQSYMDVRERLIHDDDKCDKTDLFYKICNIAYGGVVDEAVTVRKMRERLFEDLQNLIYAFEIYLTGFVEQITIGKLLPEISKISPDYVISFNYTKTYERQYNGSVPVCHIHGTCERDRKLESNNMVLGIDEYVDGQDRFKRVDFSIFKKFIQRIRNHNDVSYAAWAAEIEKIGTKRRSVGEAVDGKIVRTVDESFSDIYIYGHSLDVTDKDILRRFFMNDAARLHIFAYDKATEGDLISNLLKIMDEDIVIKKSTASPPMIEFITGV